MAEPKAKTLQQKLGFFDEDLKSPVHDDILKWLDNNLIDFIYEIYDLREWHKGKVEQQKKLAERIFSDNINGSESSIVTLNEEKTILINELPELQKEYSDQLIDEEKSSDYDYSPSRFTLRKIDANKKRLEEIETEIEEINARLITLKEWNGLGELPTRCKIKIIDNPWEFPVTSQSSISGTGYRSGKNIVGFIDLKVTFEYTQLSLTGIDFHGNKIIGNVNWTQTKRKKIEDYTDKSLCEHTIFVEVKTKISSLGELFRQLRMYQEYVSDEFIIVCPDDTEKKVIESQGYKFYKYDPTKKFNIIT